MRESKREITAAYLCYDLREATDFSLPIQFVAIRDALPNSDLLYAMKVYRPTVDIDNNAYECNFQLSAMSMPFDRF